MLASQLGVAGRHAAGRSGHVAGEADKLRGVLVIRLGKTESLRGFLQKWVCAT